MQYWIEQILLQDEEIGESINAQVVEQAVTQAIRNWREINDQD